MRYDTVSWWEGKTTLKDISEILGKETIDLYNTSDTRGNNPSYGLNYQKTGKELLSQDEIAVMDGGKCIMQLRGVRPFLSNKYDITKHKRYKCNGYRNIRAYECDRCTWSCSDYDEKNTFDIEGYLNTKLKLKKSDVVEVYNMGEIKSEAKPAV